MPVATSSARAGPSRERQGRFVAPASVAREDDDERPVKPVIEEEEGWTIDTFKDVPITKTEPIIQFLKGLQESCKGIAEKIDDGLTKATDAAKLIEKTSEDDPMIDKIDVDIRKGIERKEIVRIKSEVLGEMIVQLRQNQSLVDPIGVYTEQVKLREKAYTKQTARQKFKENRDYIEFREAIWDVHHQGGPRPFMTSYLPMEDGDESDDDEMQVGPQTQTFRCMITLRPFENAVTCTECKHSYSKAAIMGLLKGKKSVKCPSAGCNVAITQAKLQDDPQLQRRSDQHVKREAERQKREDEEEDEE